MDLWQNLKFDSFWWHTTLNLSLVIALAGQYGLFYRLFLCNTKAFLIHFNVRKHESNQIELRLKLKIKNKIKITHMCKIIVANRSSTSCHTSYIFIRWTYKKMITDCLTNLMLILESIVNIFPICVLKLKYYINKTSKPTHTHILYIIQLW